MKIVVNNVNNYSIGYKGSYFPAVTQKRVNGNKKYLHQLINHKDLDVVDVENYNIDNLELEELKLIADIKNIDIYELDEDDIILKLKGEYEEIEEIKEIEEEIKEIEEEEEEIEEEVYEKQEEMIFEKWSEEIEEEGDV